jgi:hypothetical protein|nr:hypothetical protein [Kofleriaceae bacterium]
MDWLSWLPLGVRRAGRVDRHVTTRFAHVAYLPLVPLYSEWSGDARPRRIACHGASVAAAYARGWLPVVVTALAATGRDELVACSALIGLLWAWSWRFCVRSSAEVPAMARDVLGTTCPPAYWRAADRAAMQGQLAARWRARADGRSADDIAALGPRDRDEAELAVAMLVLSAPAHGDAGDRVLAKAARISCLATAASLLPVAPARAVELPAGAMAASRDAVASADAAMRAWPDTRRPPGRLARVLAEPMVQLALMLPATVAVAGLALNELATPAGLEHRTQMALIGVVVIWSCWIERRMKHRRDSCRP